jgi:hypothetical protein
MDGNIPSIWNITNIDKLDEDLLKEVLPHYKNGNKKLDNLITNIYNSKINSVQIRELDSIIKSSRLDLNNLTCNELRKIIKESIRTYNCLYKDKQYSDLDGVYRFNKLNIVTDYVKYSMVLNYVYQ